MPAPSKAFHPNASNPTPFPIAELFQNSPLPRLDDSDDKTHLFVNSTLKLGLSAIELPCEQPARQRIPTSDKMSDQTATSVMTVFSGVPGADVDDIRKAREFVVANVKSVSADWKKLEKAEKTKANYHELP